MIPPLQFSLSMRKSRVDKSLGLAAPARAGRGATFPHRLAYPRWAQRGFDAATLGRTLG